MPYHPQAGALDPSVLQGLNPRVASAVIEHAQKYFMTEHVKVPNCIEHVFSHIQGCVYQDLAYRHGLYPEIEQSQLQEAAYAVGIFDNPAKDLLLVTDFRRWAHRLKQNAGWQLLRYKNNHLKKHQEVILWELLQEAYNAWLRSHNRWTKEHSNLKEKPFDKRHPSMSDTSCCQFLTDYIRRHSKPESGGLRVVDFELLRKSAHAASLHGFEGSGCDLSNDDYSKWAKILIEKEDVAERKPPLRAILKEGRTKWQRMKSSNNTSSNGVITPSTFAEVSIVDNVSDELQDDSAFISRRCDFCTKETQINNRTHQMLQSIVKGKKFFCPFCVRYDLHTKKQRHVLIISLRAMIGYLYYMRYTGRVPDLYFSQLRDMVQTHVSIGEMNPVFSYDPESFCWFIDFNRVGKAPHKIPLVAVLHTVIEMITAFNPYEHIKDFKSHKYINRFIDSLNEFYNSRRRPVDKPICAPTLHNCASNTKEMKKGADKKLDIASYRSFTPSKFHPHKMR
jgi:hypothetical protein